MSAIRDPDFDWKSAFDRATQDGDERPTWAYDWPAGQRMRRELSSLIDLRDKSVCDLGCGRGQLGFAAIDLGARFVHFCDHSSEILDFVQRKIDENDLIQRAGTATHRWGADIPGAPFDVILGGDILYRPECFAELLHSIASSLSPVGCALLADPRLHLENELFELSISQGLKSVYSRRDSYSLIEIRYQTS